MPLRGDVRVALQHASRTGRERSCSRAERRRARTSNACARTLLHRPRGAPARGTQLASNTRMSGFLAFTCGQQSLPAALKRLSSLGGDRERLWSGENAVVAVTRKEWEMEDDLSGPMLVLETDDVVVAADATLYDRASLVRALRSANVEPLGSTATHLIEAAWRAWGIELVDHLNGDFAFVIWDRHRRRMVAARDPYGLRALFMTSSSGSIAVGSSSRALAELRGHADDLNVDRLALQAGGLVWSLGTDTCFRGVETVRPGYRLVWDRDHLAVDRFWHPPAAPDKGPSDRETAARDLRARLRTAVAERMGKATTAVWMSGGWDSTAVFGAGQSLLKRHTRSRLQPVSMTFPAGDPGCEDALIVMVAVRWNSPVHWVRSEEISL